MPLQSHPTGGQGIVFPDRPFGRPSVRCPSAPLLTISRDARYPYYLGEGISMKLGTKYSSYDWALFKRFSRSQRSKVKVSLARQWRRNSNHWWSISSTTVSECDPATHRLSCTEDKHTRSRTTFEERAVCIAALSFWNFFPSSLLYRNF